MKEVIDKGKFFNNSLPGQLILDNRNIFEQKIIVNSFTGYFVKVGSKVVSKLPQLQRSFEMYPKRSDSSLKR